MFSAEVLSLYLRLALAVCGLGIAAVAFRWLRAAHVSDRWNLRVARILLATAVVLSFVPVPRPFVGPIPSAQVWAAPSMRMARVADALPVVSLEGTTIPIPLPPLRRICLLLLGAGLLFAFFRLTRNVLTLQKLRRESFLLRRMGRLEIRTTALTDVPLSFWIPRVAVVLVPEYLLEHAQDLSLAIRHELQHQRQGDTRWLYVLEMLNAIFFWNPFAWFFSRVVCEIQEFACDETLVRRKHVSPRAYGGCLLRVAETMRLIRAEQVGTACAAADSSASTLKRRILHMLIEKKKSRFALAAMWLGTVACLSCVVTAWAAQFGLQDRRITQAQAEAAVAAMTRNPSFPITLNESVLKQLNLYAGTPDGREYIQNSLARLENYRPLVEELTNNYRVPEELIAIPIMESGYQNLPQSSQAAHSAGIWQFIPQTARNFGLRVDMKKDERLDVEKETDAAMRYLSSLNMRFQDWELAILSYNAGENRVQKGIQATGSRNAWEVIRAGFGGDDNYLPKVIASVILMKSPQLLR